MLKILELYENIEQNTIEIICLAYSVTIAGSRKMNVFEKFYHITGKTLSPEQNRKIVQNFERKPINNANPHSYSILFILGFFLGDGYGIIRIRKVLLNLQFIPNFSITQKKDPINRKLFEEIQKFLKHIGVMAIIKEEKANFVLTIEGKNRVGKLLSFFPQEYFFWKKAQIVLLNKVIKLLSLKILF